MIQSVSIITLIIAVIAGAVVGVFILKRIFAENDQNISQLSELCRNFDNTLAQFETRIHATEEAGGQRLIRDTLTKYEEALHLVRLLQNDIAALKERVEQLSLRETRRARDEQRRQRREERQEREEEEEEEPQTVRGSDGQEIPEEMIHPAFRRNARPQQPQVEPPRRKFGTLSA
jgi:Skp family chaperone for outer membrane proteins